MSPPARIETARPPAQREVAEAPKSEMVQTAKYLISGDTPAEKRAGLNAFKSYFERNRASATPDDMSGIQKLVAESGVAGPEDADLMEYRVEAPVETPTETTRMEVAPVMSAENGQALAEIEHIDEMIDMLDDGKVGSLLDLGKKLPGWEQKLATLPARSRSNPTVRKVDARLRQLAGKIELQKIKADPRYRN